MVLPVHYGTHHALTIDVPIDTADGEIQLKQVRGHEYTSAAATARFLHGDLIDDEDLVRMLDGPSAVWTRESIEEYWRRVLVYYSLLVSSLIVAVVCLGVFIDGVVQERLEIRASAQFARMMARRRAARRRQG